MAERIQEEEMMIGVALLLQTDEQMEEMVEFLKEKIQENKLMVEDDMVLKKALEIRHRTK